MTLRDRERHHSWREVYRALGVDPRQHEDGRMPGCRRCPNCAHCEGSTPTCPRCREVSRDD